MTFRVTATGSDTFKLATLCQKYANSLWIPDHLCTVEKEAFILDQFKRAVQGGVAMIEVQSGGADECYFYRPKRLGHRQWPVETTIFGVNILPFRGDWLLFSSIPPPHSIERAMQNTGFSRYPQLVCQRPRNSLYLDLYSS